MAVSTELFALVQGNTKFVVYIVQLNKYNTYCSLSLRPLNFLLEK